MTRFLKFLCVEDVYTDAELIRMELVRSGLRFDFVVVDTKSAYIQALNEYVPDVIICDHSLPAFNSFEALTILRQRERIVPFILTTGSMSDDLASELVKKGADDYIIKDRLGRLTLSVLNALEKHDYEKERIQLLWKARENEEKSRRDLSGLSRKLTLAAKAAKLTIWEYYPETDVIVTDSALYEVLGYDVSHYTRSLNDWISLTHPDDVKIIYGVHESNMMGGKEFDVEYRMLLPNSSIVYVWVKGIVELDDNGSVYRILGTTENITEGKLNEKRIKENEIRYRSIWENTLDGLILGTPDGKLLAANPAACNILGRSEHELQKRGRAGFVVKDQVFSKTLMDRTANGRSSGELTMRRGDGSTFLCEISSSVFENASNQKNIVTVIRDISERKRLEMEVERQRKRYSEIFEAAPSAICYIAGPNHLIEMANPVLCQLTGNRDLIGKTIKEAFSELDNHPIHQILHDVYHTGKAYHSAETCFPLDVDGTGNLTDIYVEFAYLPHRDENNVVSGVFFFANNVTKQVEFRQKISDRQKNYKNLFELSPISKFVISATDYSVLSANRTAQSLYGYTAEEFSHLNFSRLFKKMDPEIFRQSSNLNHQYKLTVDHVKSTGEPMLVELSIADFIYKGADAFLIVANDITEQTRLQQSFTDMMISAQKKITKAEIKGQEKEKEVIGKELHDNINQQLCTVQLLLNLARSEPEKYAEVLPKCESVIQSAIADIRSLCKSLVPPSIKDIGLTASLHELTALFRSTAPYELDLEAGQGLDELESELQFSIYRIVQELLTNITKYAKATKVTVKTNAEAGQFTLVVEDDGVGFDTKKKNTGLGLANIRNRVELFGGKIKLKSTPGKGCKTEVIIHLGSEPTAQQAQTLRILVAEDDLFDQEMIKTTFTSIAHACEINFVTNGKELLKRLSVTPDEELPSLIVLDYNMPLLDGLNTLRELKDWSRIRNIPKIIYSTSHHRSYEEECKKADASDFIKKGITPEDMRKDMTRMLRHVNQLPHITKKNNDVGNRTSTT